MFGEGGGLEGVGVGGGPAMDGQTTGQTTDDITEQEVESLLASSKARLKRISVFTKTKDLHNSEKCTTRRNQLEKPDQH